MHHLHILLGVRPVIHLQSAQDSVDQTVNGNLLHKKTKREVARIISERNWKLQKARAKPWSEECKLHKDRKAIFLRIKEANTAFKKEAQKARRLARKEKGLNSIKFLKLKLQNFLEKLLMLIITWFILFRTQFFRKGSPHMDALPLTKIFPPYGYVFK